MKKLGSLFFVLSFILFPIIKVYSQSHPATPIPAKIANFKKRFKVSRSPLADQSLWCASGQEETFPNFKHFTKMDENYKRSEYIQRKNDKKPILFYEHERMIDFTLGHQKSLILINDSMASKGNQVMVSNLETRNIFQIDKKMKSDYFSQLFPKHHPSTTTDSTLNRDRSEIGSWTLPIAMGFSPDDRKVLIHMEGAIEFAWSPDPKEEARLKSLYQDWFYVVDSKNGSILKIYKTNSPPVAWWKF